MLYPPEFYGINASFHAAPNNLPQVAGMSAKGGQGLRVVSCILHSYNTAAANFAIQSQRTNPK
jgi:hypothetical protein